MLLGTKLRRPSIPPRRVPRQHLIARLNDGLASGRQVTLVSAPAGFGKTTVAAEWASAFDGPSAWLSLDPADDDPARFAAYLVAALQGVDERVGAGVEGALRAGHLPPPGALSTALLNDILEVDTRFLLVLDDLQVVQDRFIYDVLEQFITHQPASLHLVLVTREDPPLPLARLRAHNRLMEIRAEDLRFTEREADSFLNKVMGLALSQVDLAALDDKIEGWIVGLQLVAIALQTASPGDRPLADPAGPRFIAGLSGSHRFILGYLTEEVLSRQPADVTDFLLQTSILDSLSGDLCDAVTGRTDSQRLLEMMLNANLFLIPLDDEQRWYRYHHLFADLLRARQHALDPQRAAELHRRASRWYARDGRVRAAMAHALAARDYQAVVDLVERHATELVLQGNIKTVEGWMQAIPPEWSARSVRANMAFAWMYFMQEAAARALSCVERLRAILATLPAGGALDPALEAEWLALQATARNAQGRPDEGLALATRALEVAPAADHAVCSRIYLALARAHRLRNDVPGALTAFQRIVEHGRQASNAVVELLGLAGLSAMAIQRGQLHLAFDLSTQAVDRVEQSGSLPPISATVYGALGQVCYEWNRIEEAHAHLRRAVQISTLSGYRDVETSYRVLLSLIAEVEGDLDAAAREIRTAADELRGGAPVWLRAEVALQQVRVHLARGDVVAAGDVLRHSGVSADDAQVPDTDAFHLAYLRLACHQACGRDSQHALDDARVVARRIAASAQVGERSATVLRAWLFLALAEWACGDVAASLQSLSRAVSLGEPEGYLRVFYDEGAAVAELLRHAQQRGIGSRYVDRLIALFPAPHAPAADVGLVEPLSGRELEILSLIREGCSNRDIAERLSITLHTVKKHTSNIYGKLGVNSRTQAVALARELELLDTGTTFE